MVGDIIFFLSMIVSEILSIMLLIKGNKKKDYFIKAIGFAALLYSSGCLASIILFYVIKWY